MVLMIDLKEPKDIRELIRQWIHPNRLDFLEPLPTPDPDIMRQVLTSLKDSDIELLAEFASLREAGFDEGQTAQMMGSRHKQALKSVEHFQSAYQAIEKGLFLLEKGVHGHKRIQESKETSSVRSCGVMRSVILGDFWGFATNWVGSEKTLKH
jgi:hypothetical protein